eukprot:9914688-Alexandrium_andersonii.AAC.1
MALQVPRPPQGEGTEVAANRPLPVGGHHPCAVVSLHQEAGDVAGSDQEVRKDQGLGRPTDVRRQVVDVGGRGGPG